MSHNAFNRVRLTAAAVAALTCFLSAQEIANEPRREKWQRVPELFAALGVHPGAVIADIGAGEGFLTVRLADAIGPSGKVYAVDNVAVNAAGLRNRLMTSNIANVEVIVSDSDNPHLPQGALDAAVILNAYHEMPAAILGHVYAALKPGGRLVLCEPTPSELGLSRQAHVEDHVIAPELMIADLREAGFTILQRQDNFATNLAGNRYALVVATRPAN